MSPRQLLKEAFYRPDAFDLASMRSVGAQRPLHPVSFSGGRQ